jgi:hypothetical protein
MRYVKRAFEMGCFSVTRRRSHDYYMASVGSDTKIANLRADPRYDELLRRMNIPAPSR